MQHKTNTLILKVLQLYPQNQAQTFADITLRWGLPHNGKRTLSMTLTNGTRCHCDVLLCHSLHGAYRTFIQSVVAQFVCALNVFFFIFYTHFPDFFGNLYVLLFCFFFQKVPQSFVYYFLSLFCVFFSLQLFIFYHLLSASLAPSRWFSTLTFFHCGELSVYSSVAKNNFWQNASMEHTANARSVRL